MARIAFPYEAIESELKKLKITPERFGYYEYDYYRVYRRVDGKFIPYGWNVESRPKAVEQFELTFPDPQLQ